MGVRAGVKIDLVTFWKSSQKYLPAGTFRIAEPMKQIELRLALVLYGGVSLAVYMHGVTREFLNLLRASKAYRRAHEPLAEEKSAPSPPVQAYLDIFEKLGPDLELRVIIDVISGASAGGINGVMLARAIAHDLSLGSHRDLWLSNADVDALTHAPEPRDRALKWAIAPLIDRVISSGMRTPIRNEETRRKLRNFVQARWFTPPFAGDRFTGWMLDACAAMGEEIPGQSLLPPGHRLDLFVTLTDFQGHLRKISLDDPSFILENEHRRITRFTCRYTLSGDFDSEFTSDHVPGLIFCARATSSFPGAFPPASISEMDKVLSDREQEWPHRNAFLQDKLADNPDDQFDRYFIDGSVVMNKPFAPVVGALENRPANREVTRRIVYVDPLPRERRPGFEDQSEPGFFKAILASIAQIPRNEPISDDLQEIEDRNIRVRRVTEVIEAADPAVEEQVRQIIKRERNKPLTMRQLTKYRNKANEIAHKDAGYAHLSYQRLKLRILTEDLSGLIARLSTRAEHPIDSEQILPIVERWVDTKESERKGSLSNGSTPPEIIDMLRKIDVNFRVRRLRFVIRRLNELYRHDEAKTAEKWSGAIDELKSTLYELVEQLNNLWDVDLYPISICREAADFVRLEDPGPEAVEDFMGSISDHMDLEHIDASHDDVFTVMALNYLSKTIRHRLTTAYVGFAFYDLITFPILQWHDLAEVNETLIDRISPQDAHNLSDEPVELKGTEMHSFGAFFNRTWREHDYLWGRLNGADRLVSIVLLTVDPQNASRINADEIRRNLFLAILNQEEKHLTADPDLVPRVRRQVLSRFSKEADRSSMDTGPEASAS